MLVGTTGPDPEEETAIDALTTSTSRGQAGTDRAAIVVDGLRKAFGQVKAVDGVDLEVAPGTILGLLGPNGAGKTTIVRILTTLLRPDDGRAQVAGYDVVRDAAALRSVIGLAGQYAAVDENLTGRENLELVGVLYHLGREEARRRAGGLLERFGLAPAGNREVKTYSGGMRRRLDLAASLVGRPAVLFLDEPTTGLDPRGRMDLWEVIRELVSDGTTLLLTTQYMEEADQLAHRIVVIDHGRVIEQGTADELKDRVGGEVLELEVADRSALGTAVGELVALGTGAPAVDNKSGRITLPVGQAGTMVLADTVRRMDAAQIPLSHLSLRRPSLDDVFLALTGHAAEDEEREDGQGRPGRQRQREGPAE
jgi:ABC-2 type transport system ATP-binding protein